MIYICVNALSRAITISTYFINETGTAEVMCQCPQTSNNHFYFPADSSRTTRSEVCQCPQTSNNHFYFVDCTLKGGYIQCQCPQTSNNHFYERNNRPRWSRNLCQCPQTSNNHFYGTLWKSAIYKAFQICFCK